MSATLALPPEPAEAADALPRPNEAERKAVAAAVATACNRIAPLWPLKHFVAVNPFLGFADQGFDAACATLRRVAGIDMLPARAFHREALASGRVEDQDLAAALAAAPLKARPAADLETLKTALACEPQRPTPAGARVATVAEVLDALAPRERRASRSAFMIDEISKWCAAYFDEGQAAWKLPTRGLAPYAAWRASMRHDRNPEALGVRGFRAAVASVPQDPEAAIAAVVRALGIPAPAVADYLYRALADIGGWAAYVRYRVWDSALHGREDDGLVQLLAIRVVWGYALFLEREDAVFAEAWRAAMAKAAAPLAETADGGDSELAIDLVLQDAYEGAFRRRLLAQLTSPAAAVPPPPGRPGVQAAFCIDVRSEVFRRALETACPEVRTLGFAGFFGFPIEYVPIGRTTGGAQCPVLLKPAFVVCEAVEGASEVEAARVLGLRLLRRRAAKAWKAFKLSAVSSFAYVETAGLVFAGKLAGDALGLTRPVVDPNADGLDAATRARIGPRLEPRQVGGRATGFPPAQRADMAESVLRAMSLTHGFARLVLLAGHGSTTVNTPHASGLDCGACGGHTGEANARVAAAVLNDPGVRTDLRDRGIAVPDDTWFLAALHDTTTDEVTVFDDAHLPPGHRGEVEALRGRLRQASTLARRARAPRLGLAPTRRIDADIVRRSRDWSQVRPEWGLAGCAAFIAAPRHRTRGLDLEGRAFLHDYDWTEDQGFRVLELIMTAPVVVASWISLQYYGSTVNTRAFGGGDKTLHNVAGQLGVLEGNGGDLRVGLPLQSVHDGARFVHEPMRLNVFIAAPEGEIHRVVARHEGVRHLVENRWLHLFALADDGLTIRRYVGKGTWATAG